MSLFILTADIEQMLRTRLAVLIKDEEDQRNGPGGAHSALNIKMMQGRIAELRWVLKAGGCRV